MKRKGRKHMPKVGTKQDLAWEHKEGVAHLEHPFSDDPTRRTGMWAGLLAVGVVILLIIAAIGWLVIT
jgi:hypothetical protein